LRPPTAEPAAAVAARPSARRALVVAVAIAALSAVAWVAIPDPVHRRVVALGGGALALWLSELVPPFVPTLALLAGVPLLLGDAGPEYRLGAVLGWVADPVLALFFGGFALGAAASRHGIDAWVAAAALALSGGSRRRLLALVMAATAVLSMWMSNIAAAAMMLAALRPLLRGRGPDDDGRSALLLGVAMAANLGGMSTPIGSGPNAIAIAALEPRVRITFVQWMSFATPLMLVALAVSLALIAVLHRVGGRFDAPRLQATPRSGRARGLIVVFALAVGAWLTEPLHGVPAPLVALAVAAVLFGMGWLSGGDLGRIDWSTLILIAGGLVLGRLADASGLVAVLAERAAGLDLSPALRVTGLVALAATMSALMSNTASAALLIALVAGLGLPPSSAVLIAIGTAFGVPFAISTPPNAMAVGEGLPARELLRVGLPLMLLGTLLVGLTGPHVLRVLGLP
jgi:sodium-dependent dicarboxylate transporter 2/3/5